MSWSSPLRVLGVCGLWLAVQTGCGGNPSVSNGNQGTDGGTTSGGSGTGVGAGGGFVIGTGGEGDSTGEGGTGEMPADFVCGNKVLEPGEFCDDGNTANGDGCSGDCKDVNLDYDCSTVGEPCVKVVNCGNGILEGEEACDDGNTADDDGCSFDCGEVEEGWVCIRPGKDCVEKPVCGNGTRDRGEQCDDGDKVAGDGCDDLCQIESGFYCPVPGEDCVEQECGDGKRVKGESCDDGNTAPNDGCAADCKSVETGWHCNVNGCKPECGDGLLKGTEACDDGNAIGGDGCSAACKVEPYFGCKGAPSVCTPQTPKDLCGNGTLDPIYTLQGGVWKATGREVCEPPNQNGCNATCDGVTVVTQPAKCNNNAIEAGETCDPPMPGMGCSSTCQVEVGFTCTQPGVCRANPKCGDGIVNAGEACDDKNVANSDGCSSTCTVEPGYTCVGLGPSICVKPVCGNGTIEPGEKCDDGNANAADGCDTCNITNGWACPTPGAACITKCGDGLKLGLEACDDGNKASGDGCNAGCKIEPGFKCPTANQKCVASVCGDGVKDTGEGCDDGGKCSAGTNKGNNCTADAQCPGTGAKCIPVAGDGCGPICQPEPTVTVGPNPTVNVVCGDGLKTGTEECDDGNKVKADGCEDDCKITKPGWTCSGKLTLPKQLQMKVTYRDFKSAAANNGHPDFMYDNLGHVAAITGGVCTSATASSTDKTKCGHLDADGKPELIVNNRATTGIRNADSFKLWYRDGNPTNLNGHHGVINTSTITSTLILNQIDDTSEVYEFDSKGNNFYPIDGQGQGNMSTEGIGCGNHGYKNYVDTNECFCDGNNENCGDRNFGFTTELRYFFQYKGGERLTFSGDDDVWVYVNGRVAVDIGGLHSQTNGQVVLGDDGNGNAGQDSNCSAHSTGDAPPDPGTDAAPGCLTTAERNNATDDRFGLTKGGVYEIALFHAERHVAASNFKLTLAGFLAPRSSCDTICGDGVIVGDEYCDDGAANSDTASAACNTSCTARAFCGDNIRQLPGEACDNGTNTDLYKTAQSAPSVCAPGCKVPASCGDGTLQPGQEQCDKGNANNNNAYGPNECRTDCKLGGYCGDTLVQTVNGETCDLGASNGTSYGANSCGYDCKAGRRCGDGIINAPDGSEKCDDGVMNGSISSHCSTTCTLVPYCGDGQIKSPEQCDSGQFNEPSPDYGGCSDMCTWGPLCGDGVKDNPEEECDDGANNNNSTYDGCTLACTLGPRCGDGVKQATESCDNGFNEDDYEDKTTAQEECGKDCMPPPYCGDATVQPAYELCDYGTDKNTGAYDGCTATCDYGPYCGDGTKNGNEFCDKGADNVGYSPKRGGCSYDCQEAPYCGDGVRNGPEQCDLGEKENTGAYGKCNADCTFAPRCGDKVVDKGEQCDEGPAGSLSCLPTCKRRSVVQ